MPREPPVIKTTFDKTYLLQKMAIPVKNRGLADQCTLSHTVCNARPPGGAAPHPDTLTETNLNTTIDYYFTPQSPWTYLGHERFAQIARAAGAAVRVLPIDLGGKVFPISGGLPLGQRAPQRQAYRLLELQRYSDYLH